MHVWLCKSILYQPSPALELVALTVADGATCDDDFDLPVTTGNISTLGHPHTTEGGGVQLSVMGDTGPAVLAPASSDANQSEEQEQSRGGCDLAVTVPQSWTTMPTVDEKDSASCALCGGSALCGAEAGIVARDMQPVDS